MRTNTEGYISSYRRLLYSKLILIFTSLCLVGASALAASSATATMQTTKSNTLLKSKTKTQSKFVGKWALGLSGESYNETNISSADDEAFVTEVALRSKFQYKMSDRLRFKIDGRLRWLTGSVQLNYREDYSKSILKIYQATVQYKPLKPVTFEVGLLNQDFLNSRLLIANRAFPGVSQRYIYKTANKRFGLSLKAQQTTPSFESFNDDRSENEELPFFTTETLEVGAIVANNIRAKAYTSHFKYSKLPSVVAQSSAELGNSVDGSLANAKFLNDFNGFVAGGELSIKRKNNYEAKVAHQIITNSDAEKNNNGSMTTLELSKNFGGFELSGMGGNFFKDRDVVPAVYSDLSYGGNNRKGQIYGLDIKLKKLGFKIVTRYTDAEVINLEVNRGDLDTYYVGMEMMYVKF